MKRILLVTALFAFLLLGNAVAGAAEEQSPTGPEACVVDQINQRRNDGLRWSGRVTVSLREHAAEMAARGDLGHGSMQDRTGLLPAGWDGYGEAVHAERLESADARGVAAWCARLVQDLWDSPPHREVLARSSYEFVSVGAYWDGEMVWVATAVFSHADYQPSAVRWPSDYAEGLRGGWKGRFLDDDGSVFEAEIERLATAGITLGCNPPLNDRFCPDEAVSRGQMAAFLVRALGLRPAGGDPFVDDDRSEFEADIRALAAAGITEGCNPPANDRFCPDRTVSRAEMATFLGRALSLEPKGEEMFTDVAGSVHRNYIQALARAGITVGCDPDAKRYCPKQPITRAQMAAFLIRAGLG